MESTSDVDCPHWNRGPPAPLKRDPKEATHKDRLTSFCSLPAQHREGARQALHSWNAWQGVFPSSSQWGLGSTAGAIQAAVPTPSVCTSSSAHKLTLASWSCRLCISRPQASKSASHTFPSSGHWELGKQRHKDYSVTAHPVGDVSSCQSTAGAQRDGGGLCTSSHQEVGVGPS
jgi:hypothetical protein